MRQSRRCGAGIHAYTVTDGLSTEYVSSLVEDSAGYIYAGTARGVDRIDPRAPSVPAASDTSPRRTVCRRANRTPLSAITTAISGSGRWTD